MALFFSGLLPVTQITADPKNQKKLKVELQTLDINETVVSIHSNIYVNNPVEEPIQGQVHYVAGILSKNEKENVAEVTVMKKMDSDNEKDVSGISVHVNGVVKTKNEEDRTITLEVSQYSAGVTNTLDVVVQVAGSERFRKVFDEFIVPNRSITVTGLFSEVDQQGRYVFDAQHISLNKERLRSSAIPSKRPITEAPSKFWKAKSS